MKENKLDLTKEILLSVAAAGGFMLIALVAPGVLQVFAPLAKKYHRQALYPSRIKRRFKSLKKQGLVMIGEHNGKTKITLTKAGRQKILEYKVEELEIKKQAPWDKQWRYVFFDIPEKKRSARDMFRSKLNELGFKKIQQSVWRHRHPCHQEIQFLAHLYGIDRYVSLVEGRVLV